MSLKLAAQQREGRGAGRPVAFSAGFFRVGEYFIAMFVMLEQRGSDRHGDKLRLDHAGFWGLPRAVTLTAVKRRATPPGTSLREPARPAWYKLRLQAMPEDHGSST
jgi:hypothetical protein